MKRSILSLCVALSLFVTPVLADDEADAAKIEAKLKAKTMESVSFEDTPLKDAIQEIASAAAISIVIDSKNVDEDKEVSLQLVNISAENALSLLLKQQGLVKEFTNGVLYVTTKDAADKNPTLITKTYDVRDITVKVKDFKGPKVRLKGEDDNFNDDDDDNDAEEERNVSIDDLMETIEDTVEPESWDKEGRAMAKFKGNLVITTTRDVHKKVAKLLNQLR